MSENHSADRIERKLRSVEALPLDGQEALPGEENL